MVHDEAYVRTPKLPPRTFIIAEAGSCHDNSQEKAFQLCEMAKALDCSAVKFQYWSSASRLADRRRVPNYLGALYATYQMPTAWLDDLAEYCAKLKIEFMCTAYLPEDVHVVEPFVKRFKIASFEAKDHHFRAIHREFRKPIVLSTGMMSGEDIANLSDIGYMGAQQMGDTLLHCISAYPCSPHDLHLRVIGLMAARMRSSLERLAPVGLSDHTQHPLTGALAVAVGATMIEFHLRHNKTKVDNPDYATARTMSEAKTYVRNIRQAEFMMGPMISERPQIAAEDAMRKYRV